MVRKIARSIQLPRDRQHMDSLSMGDLLDQSVVNSIRVGSHILSSIVDKLDFMYGLG